MHWSELDGVVFIEESYPGVNIISHVTCSIHGLFSQAQLKNLNDVKRKLAREVKSKGGNCLINFKYGQKSSFWTTLIGIDNVNWYGEGDVGRMSDVELNNLRKSKNKDNA